METTPTTKLEAVNVMLATIREAPVNSLSSGLVDAELAETMLDNVSRAVQSKGYYFNRETDYTFAPDVNGEIILPTEFIKADLAASERIYRSSTNEYVLRGRKMYDTVEHTFAISTSLVLDIVRLLDFTDLPETCRRYIALRAGRMFQEKILGSGTLSDFQVRDEVEAKIDFLQEVGENADYNIFDSAQTGNAVLRNMRPLSFL